MLEISYLGKSLYLDRSPLWTGGGNPSPPAPLIWPQLFCFMEPEASCTWGLPPNTPQPRVAWHLCFTPFSHPLWILSSTVWGTKIWRLPCRNCTVEESTESWKRHLVAFLEVLWLVVKVKYRSVPHLPSASSDTIYCWPGQWQVSSHIAMELCLFSLQRRSTSLCWTLLTQHHVNFDISPGFIMRVFL